MERIIAANVNKLNLQGSTTPKGFQPFAPHTTRRLSEHLTQGFDLVVGNDPKLGDRPKWAEHECVRLNYRNDRTVWAVRSKTNPPLHRIITAGRAGSDMATVRATKLSFPLYCVKLYEARPRKADGVYTYRLVDHLSGSLTWYPTVEHWARERAEKLGLPFGLDVTHGKVLIEPKSSTCTDTCIPVEPLLWETSGTGELANLFA